MEVRLYPQNKDLIRVEVQDREKWEKLRNCEEEIGKNCRLGGLSVNQAIGQGFFGRSGKLMRSEEMGQSNRKTKERSWAEYVESSKALDSGKEIVRVI